MIEKNLKKIKMNMEMACQKAGFKEKVNLIAVTKNVSVENMKIAKSLGITDFGENKVQELLEKYHHFQDVNWHFIGNLQTNKVKKIIDKVCLIHSVNSFKLASEIDKRAKEINKIIDILIEVNIADEASKKGIKLEEIYDFLAKLVDFKNIRIKGIMCIAPFSSNPEEVRGYFEKMKKLFVDISVKNQHNISMKFISMGMTNDYIQAIEEGSNIVRIGTGIFKYTEAN